MQRLNKAFASIFIGIAMLAITAPASNAEIVLDTAFPVEKQPTRIHVGTDGYPVADALITVTYRPGSAVPAEFELGRTASDGNCEWTPREAGIVTISAAWTDEDGVEQTATMNTSVKYNPTPVVGILIMIIAGIVLIGGSVDRIARLLRTPEAG